MEKTLTLIGYTSECYEMAELDKLYWSYDFPYNNFLTLDTIPAFGGC